MTHRRVSFRTTSITSWNSRANSDSNGRRCLLSFFCFELRAGGPIKRRRNKNGANLRSSLAYLACITRHWSLMWRVFSTSASQSVSQSHWPRHHLTAKPPSAIWSTHSPQTSLCQAVALPTQRASPSLSARFVICMRLCWIHFHFYSCFSFSRISPLTREHVKLDSPLKTYASPRLDWMALRIQGKHFASKSELIIDPFPELQTTSVRAKSQCSVQCERENRGSGPTGY